MPRKIEVDSTALMQMIKDKVPQNEIMEKFGFKNVTQLKVAYANAIMETGAAPALKNGTPKKPTRPDTTIAVNGKGTIVIPKSLAKHWGFRVGDQFDAKKTDFGIQLKHQETGLNIPR